MKRFNLYGKLPNLIDQPRHFRAIVVLQNTKPFFLATHGGFYFLSVGLIHDK